MPLTQEQIDKLCRMVDNTWAENENFMATTKCTTCGQVRKCITSVVDLVTTCKECYTKERLKKIEEDEKEGQNTSQPEGLRETLIHRRVT